MAVLFFVLGYILGAVGMLMLLAWYGKKYHGKGKRAGER